MRLKRLATIYDKSIAPCIPSTTTLFLALNFDGGTALDRVMLTVSGTAMWLPLYALILWLVWRRSGWRGMLIFTGADAGWRSDSRTWCRASSSSNGVLGGLLPDFEPRPRPMFTPSLEGLDITPDSLRVMRREAVPHHWAVHVPPEAVSGMYGTVSAHAATIVALAVLACGAIRRRWFTGLMVVCSLVICYSRIYLGKHFPDGPRMGHAGRRRARIRRTAGLPPSDPPGFRRRLTHPGRLASGRRIPMPPDNSFRPGQLARITRPDDASRTIRRAAKNAALFHSVPRPVRISAEFINFARLIVKTFKNIRYEHRTQ